MTFPTLPDVVVSDIQVTPLAPSSGTQLQIQWTLTNQGSADALGNWTDRVSLSGDSLGSTPVLLDQFDFSGLIASGESLTRVQVVTLSTFLSGTRWLVVETDAGNTLFEHDADAIWLSQNQTLDEFDTLLLGQRHLVDGKCRK